MAASDVGGNLTVNNNCNIVVEGDDPRVGLTLNRFISGILAPRSGFNGANWSHARRELASKNLYDTEIEYDDRGAYFRWEDNLYVGGSQLRSLDGAKNIRWLFELRGVRGWYEEAHFSPLEFLTGNAEEGRLTDAIAADIASVDGALTPIACNKDFGLDIWAYRIEYPGKQEAIFVEMISYGAALYTVFYSIHLTAEIDQVTRLSGNVPASWVGLEELGNLQECKPFRF